MDFHGSRLSVNDLRSTSDKVSEVIRRAIITKAIPAGERIVEAKIAKELGVSITPVRQAFAKLAVQGLLEIYPFKGTNVTIITDKYVSDVIYARILLEPAAINLCFESLTKKDTDILQSYCELSDDFFKKGDLYVAIDYDVKFHNFFFERCGNELLVSMWNSIKNRIEYIQSYTKPQTLPERYMKKRHGRIIESMVKGDKQKTIDLMIEHLETSNTYATFKSAKAYNHY